MPGLLVRRATELAVPRGSVSLEHGDPSVAFHVVLRVARALGILDTLSESLDPLNTDLGRARRAPGAETGAMIHPDVLQVHVDIEGETLFAGRVHFHRSRDELSSSTFQYEASYLAHPRAYPLDPQLELFSGNQQVSTGLPGAFTDSQRTSHGQRDKSVRTKPESFSESA